MRPDAVRESVGCLLIGETKRMQMLKESLTARGIETVRAVFGGDVLASVQEGLQKVRGSGGVCIAAEGEYWPAALALAVQLCVDRIALIDPMDRCRDSKDECGKQIDRLRSFARRNLFFCVSEVLVMENADNPELEKQIDRMCKGLCNARIQRVKVSEQRWTNCEFFPFETVARFLYAGEYMFSLAK